MSYSVTKTRLDSSPRPNTILLDPFVSNEENEYASRFTAVSLTIFKIIFAVDVIIMRFTKN
jgi:hypothetical protein